MTKDEVLKQAYEALVPLSNAGSPQEREILTDDDQVAAYKAMKAIEKAFAQTEQEPAWYHAECDDPDRSGFFKEASDAATQVNDHGGHVTPLYTTPPQHKPLTEQLSKITEDEANEYLVTVISLKSSVSHMSALVDDLRALLSRAMSNFKRLHSASSPDNGPDMNAIIPAKVFASAVDEDAALLYAIKHGPHDGMIVNTPQREWVGLTDEERDKLALDSDGWHNQTLFEITLYVETKLKERNT